MTLKIPSSVNVGVRPSDFRMRSYSSGVIPWSRNSSGVIAVSWAAGFSVSVGFMAIRAGVLIFACPRTRGKDRRRQLAPVLKLPEDLLRQAPSRDGRLGT